MELQRMAHVEVIFYVMIIGHGSMHAFIPTTFHYMKNFTKTIQFTYTVQSNISTNIVHQNLQRTQKLN